MQAPGRTIEEIMNILDSAFKPLVCEVEPLELQASFSVSCRMAGRFCDHRVPRSGKGLVPVHGLQNNDTDLTNFVNHARDLVQKNTATKSIPGSCPSKAPAPAAVCSPALRSLILWRLLTGLWATGEFSQNLLSLGVILFIVY